MQQQRHCHCLHNKEDADSVMLFRGKSFHTRNSSSNSSNCWTRHLLLRHEISNEVTTVSHSAVSFKTRTLAAGAVAIAHRLPVPVAVAVAVAVAVVLVPIVPVPAIANQPTLLLLCCKRHWYHLHESLRRRRRRPQLCRRKYTWLNPSQHKRTSVNTRLDILERSFAWCSFLGYWQV